MLRGISAEEWILLISEKDTFEEFIWKHKFYNPIDFPTYEAKFTKAQEKTGLTEAVLTGCCRIGLCKTVIIVMDSRFMMGSLGTASGEIICRAFEYAAKKKLPVVAVISSGGARMHEGTYSLIQMVNTSAAVRKHNEKGLLYISVITDPTLGGVSASFASLADIIIAEPDATFGFTGQRIIENTMNTTFPENFQKGTFALQSGAVDILCEHMNIKDTVNRVLTIHTR